jgi:hypothetical protein
MVKSRITFIIEDRDGELFFVAYSLENKLYEDNISNKEVDIFDCIETFMSEYTNLFRGSARSGARQEEAIIPTVVKIKWTSNTTE